MSTRSVSCDKCAARLVVEMPTDPGLAAHVTRQMDQALRDHVCRPLNQVEITVGFSDPPN